MSGRDVTYKAHRGYLVPDKSSLSQYLTNHHCQLMPEFQQYWQRPEPQCMNSCSSHCPSDLCQYQFLAIKYTYTQATNPTIMEPSEPAYRV